ncbi:MAG TPA: hypothetical protein VFW03_28120 [Gemmatimonadaceae bacterium]|nr:hypothetical protein [Gemmatimonadaceae bacterium]
MRYDRIEIHFRTTDGSPRMVVLDPDTDIKAIMLDNRSGPEEPKAKGLHIVGGTVPSGEGPQVCYRGPAGLICW